MERKVHVQGPGVTRNGGPLRLPDPIIYYLEAGAVTEDHVRRASMLRELCGSALRSKSFSGDVRDKGSAFVDSPEAALAVLSEACPEEVSARCGAGSSVSGTGLDLRSSEVYVSVEAVGNV